MKLRAELNTYPIQSLGAKLAGEEPLDKKACVDGVSEVLIQLWQSLLPTIDVSPNDSFFERGGNSILAKKLILAINSERRFRGFNLRLDTFYQVPTIASIARLIRLHMQRNPYNFNDFSIVVKNYLLYLFREYLLCFFDHKPSDFPRGGKGENLFHDFPAVLVIH